MAENTKTIIITCPELVKGNCKLGVLLTRVVATGLPIRSFSSQIDCPKLDSIGDTCVVKITVPVSFVESRK